MEATNDSLSIIFGKDSHGNTAEERAKTSTVSFVRSQDELSVFVDGALGRTYPAREALAVFGLDRLSEAVLDGTSILASSFNEPAQTFRNRREALGLDHGQISKRTKLPVAKVIAAEDPKLRSPIRDLERIAEGLGLDETTLSFTPEARGDDNLAYRLKQWADTGLGMGPSAVLTFSEAAWVIATQQRLQSWMRLSTELRSSFIPDDNYGSGSYPVYEHARYLARKTRQALGFSTTNPIESLRTLCGRLWIPFVRVDLPKNIAGATISNNGVRGIIVNSAEQSINNVWVQRATVAHELEHLLWDPDDNLDSLRVDHYDDIEQGEDVSPHNYVEARANAFAVELIAPSAGLWEIAQGVDVRDANALQNLLRSAMDRYGLSLTAMRFHLWNALGRSFDVRSTFAAADPTDEWNGREEYTDVIFPIETTLKSRRGAFAGIVVQAQRANWISEDTAAHYLNTDVQTYNQHSQDVADLFPEVKESQPD